VTTPSEPPPTAAALHEIFDGTTRVVGLMSAAVQGESVGLVTMACATMLIVAAKRSDMSDELLMTLIETLIAARKLRDGK